LTRQLEKSRQCLAPKPGVLHTHKTEPGMVVVVVLEVRISLNIAAEYI